MSMQPIAGHQEPRIFDSHFHIIDPHYPLVPNRGYLPDPFTIEEYRSRTAGLEIVGGALVTASFQGFDQTYLVDALRRLGPSFVGVTQLPPTVSDKDVVNLQAAGVRALRFNLYRSGAEPLERLEELAHRVFDLAGWHVELYVDSRDLLELETRLAALPKVSIDHLGLSADGFEVLLRLVERGARIKATGFGRVDLDVPAALRAICSIDPSALMFGTDLPSTRAKRPFDPTDVSLVLETLGQQVGRRVLHDNAVAFYGLRPDAIDTSLV